MCVLWNTYWTYAGAKFPNILIWHFFCIAIYFQSVSASSSELVFKCCPDESELIINLNPNGKRIVNCSEIEVNVEKFTGINLKHQGINIPQCSNIELAKLDGSNGKVTSGGCIDLFNGELHHLRCPDWTEINVQYVFKCCPLGHSYSVLERECISDVHSFEKLENVFQRTTSVVQTKTPMCDENEVFVEYHVTRDQLILKRSGLRVRLSTGDEEYLEPRSFCLDQSINETNESQNVLSDMALIVRGCSPRNVCRRIPCVRKCCKVDQIIHRSNGSSICVDYPKSFRPLFYDVQLPLVFNVTPNEVIKPEYGFLETQTCKRYFLTDDPDESHYLSHLDGSLNVFNMNDSINNNDYCMDYFNGSTLQLMTFVCFTEDKEQQQLKYYAIGLTISCVFLSITLCVYACLPKLLNLHGKTVVCHVLSLLAAYISLAIVQFHTEKLKACFVLALLIYFFFLAAFCWQSVMCFDIWWTFGSIRVSRGMRKTKEIRRFLLYSTYAWGVPTILTAFVVCVDVYQLFPAEWCPQFGKTKCWFDYDNWRAHFVFFLLPIGLHILTNAILFILTSIHCSKVKGEIHRMQASNDNDTQKFKKRFLANKTKYIMNIKLFIVMGVSWLLEIFAAVLPQLSIWYFSDAFNVFQGVLVFAIFVFKAKVWISMKQKLGIKTKSAKGTTLTTATSFLTGSKENLNSIRTNKIGKSPSYSTLASSSVNLVSTRTHL